jgi:hypothetical protein
MKIIRLQFYKYKELPFWAPEGTPEFERPAVYDSYFELPDWVGSNQTVFGEWLCIKHAFYDKLLGQKTHMTWCPINTVDWLYGLHKEAIELLSMVAAGYDTPEKIKAATKEELSHVKSLEEKHGS